MAKAKQTSKSTKSDKRPGKKSTTKPSTAGKAATGKMARARSARRIPAVKPQAEQETAAAQASPVSPPGPIAQPLAEVEGAELEGVQLPAIRGKVGIFGGPKDRGFKPDAKLGLPTGRHFQYELVRSLNPNSYYCAMRWDYRQKHMSPEEGKRWWANKKLLVRNPANGKSVIVRAVDHGPHESTGLDIAISPGAAASIGVEIGDEVEIRFADQKARLGPVQGEI
jgi:hypothetical protein